jgi:hypothetical protein
MVTAMKIVLYRTLLKISLEQQRKVNSEKLYVSLMETAMSYFPLTVVSGFIVEVDIQILRGMLNRVTNIATYVWDIIFLKNVSTI